MRLRLLACLAGAIALLTGASPAHGVTRVWWAACAPGIAVELDTIESGRHEWPGATPKPGNDPPSRALDATATIWGFFRAHPRAGSDPARAGH